VCRNGSRVNLRNSWFLDRKSSSLFTRKINTTIKNFFKEVMTPLKTKQIVLILFKIKFIDENKIEYIRTLGSLLKINKKEYSRLFNILSSRLDLSDNEYKSTPVTELIINYLIVDESNTNISKTIFPKKESLTIHKIKNISLPSTMNLKLWGMQLSKIGNILNTPLFFHAA
jgi:hypothetical protein